MAALFFYIWKISGLQTYSSQTETNQGDRKDNCIYSERMDLSHSPSENCFEQFSFQIWLLPEWIYQMHTATSVLQISSFVKLSFFFFESPRPVHFLVANLIIMSNIQSLKKLFEVLL